METGLEIAFVLMVIPPNEKYIPLMEGISKRSAIELLAAGNHAKGYSSNMQSP